MSISCSDAPQRTNTNVFSEIVGISYTISYTREFKTRKRHALRGFPELGHLDAICSSIHLMTSCSFQTTEREPNWICFGKVPSFMRA